MNREDAFRQYLKKKIGLSDEKINKHFKDFKKNNKRYSFLQESLKKNVTDINEYINVELTAQDYFEYCIFILCSFTDEVITQCEFALYSYDKYKSYHANPIVRKMFFFSHSFLVHAANVYKTLKTIFKTCKISDGVETILGINHDEIDLNYAKDFRNQIEHFDEMLNAWIYTYGGPPQLDMMIISSTTKGFPINKSVRIINTSTDDYILLGKICNLQLLKNQILNIKRRFIEFKDNIQCIDK